MIRDPDRWYGEPWHSRDGMIGQLSSGRWPTLDDLLVLDRWRLHDCVQMLGGHSTARPLWMFRRTWWTETGI